MTTLRNLNRAVQSAGFPSHEFAQAVREMLAEVAERMEPAPPSEMPEAVNFAIACLRNSANVCARQGFGAVAEEERMAADALESWWRSQPAPALRMTPELEALIASVEGYCRTHVGYNTTLDFRDRIAAVRRAQASQPQRVELGKVRHLLSIMEKNCQRSGDAAAWSAAIAELDAAEGKVTG